MPARVLIVDSVATNRIVLKVKLLAARYDVQPCASIAEARALIRRDRPDLILLDMVQRDADPLEFCRDLKAGPETATIPIIVLGTFPQAGQRVDALNAGADDVLGKPVHDVMLQARIRSLLRSRDAEAELRLRDDTHHALGFAEPALGFEPQTRLTLLSPEGDRDAPSRHRALEAALGQRCAALTLDAALDHAPGGAAPDVLVLDGASLSDERFAATVFRLVSELRSRPESRHTAQLAILPPGAEAMAAMVLDIGADDLATGDVTMAELAMRCRTLARRKRQSDRLRDTVRDGLKAAVTDPLTGLYNRRYALAHLERLAKAARAERRQFAMMVLDIDHFKAFNDSYGHAVGDRVLQGVAERLRESLRPQDLVARIGGEEFLVAMPDTGAEEARIAAERLREIIGSTPFLARAEGPALSVTMSIGVAMGGADAVESEALELIFDRADAALYEAKTAGRNTVNMDRTAA